MSRFGPSDDSRARIGVECRVVDAAAAAAPGRPGPGWAAGPRAPGDPGEVPGATHSGEGRMPVRPRPADPRPGQGPGDSGGWGRAHVDNATVGLVWLPSDVRCPDLGRLTTVERESASSVELSTPQPRPPPAVLAPVGRPVLVTRGTRAKSLARPTRAKAECRSGLARPTHAPGRGRVTAVAGGGRTSITRQSAWFGCRVTSDVPIWAV